VGYVRLIVFEHTLKELWDWKEEKRTMRRKEEGGSFKDKAQEASAVSVSRWFPAST